jgi:hypothetical protein
MGSVSIKMYDKFRLILRMETTVVNVSFFKHCREVDHKDGTRTVAWAEMKKSIYSLGIAGTLAGGQSPLSGIHDVSMHGRHIHTWCGAF